MFSLFIKLWAWLWVRRAEDAFSKDKQLQTMLDDYAEHTEKISKDMEEYCKKYGGC